jgi:hypothetical protein
MQPHPFSSTPRLQDSKDSSAAGNLPPTAYHPSMVLASNEVGVYVKWALLLQEQLEILQNDRRSLFEQALALRADNRLLRKTLVDENPEKYAHIAPPDDDDDDDTFGATAGASTSAAYPDPKAGSLALKRQASAPKKADILCPGNLRELSSFLDTGKLPSNESGQPGATDDDDEPPAKLQRAGRSTRSVKK